MIETVMDAFATLRAEAAAYPLGTQMWMRLMALSFLAGILFAFHNRRALWVVAMMLITLEGLVFVRIFYPEIARIDSGAFIHLIVWPLAVYALWRPKRQGLNLASSSVISRLYPIWKTWVTGLITISLVLDIRIVALYF